MTTIRHSTARTAAARAASAATLALALSALASCRAAPPAPPPEAKAPVAVEAPPDPALAPAAFLQATASADLLEIALGRLAMERATSEAIRDFGRRMVANHTAIQVILAKLAAREGVELPTTLDPAAEARVVAFSELQGVAFDKAYMMLMAERHKEALARFQWQYDHCEDAEVKPFAVQTTPIMGTHARMAEQINSEVNREELRLAAEARAAEARAAEQRRMEEAAAAAAAVAKRTPARRAKTGTSGSSSTAR
jgi:putative membrane protein